MSVFKKALRLLEILYVRHTAIRVQDMRREFCCGCKAREQDCLMMDEYETWQMYGINALGKIKNDCQIWHEFVNVLIILGIKVQKEFTDHLHLLERNPDQAFVESLLHVYQDKDNHALLHVLHGLHGWDRQIDHLEFCAECHSSLPARYKYYVKGTEETFWSHEADHKKAYEEYLEHQLREQFKLL